ncbi:MAG: hypothetical protein Hyperionvirus3_76 [Hyperionvirus sp.]|uniref:Uncharacterized protein n=1 Tax=Hyperionvirus sp. TaxID=2487770 RepID=A0A3G5A6P7_9VIRU|nr:MAG: hypothetical protein Hyperionvirus3_76 [Hyperionvirus sp.]
MCDLNLYEIELADNHYYICAIKTKVDCLANLISKIDSEWLVAHKPKRIIHQNSIKDHFEVDKRTLYYMAKYGIENTRGGTFQKIKLTDDQKELLVNMITLHYPDIKPVRQEEKPITLPKIIRRNCLVITSEVNLYEALKRSSEKEDEGECYIDTLMFEQEEVVRYLTMKDLNSATFKPITGLGQIKTLICTITMKIYNELINYAFDCSYFVSVERIYLCPRLHNSEKGRILTPMPLLDNYEFKHDIKSNDNETIIACSFNIPEDEAAMKGGHSKQVFRNFSGAITIKTFKKIDICIIKESHYEQIIKESLIK